RASWDAPTTMRRENTSMTKATDTKPAQVATQARSATYVRSTARAGSAVSPKQARGRDDQGPDDQPVASGRQGRTPRFAPRPPAIARGASRPANVHGCVAQERRPDSLDATADDRLEATLGRGAEDDREPMRVGDGAHDVQAEPGAPRVADQ